MTSLGQSGALPVGVWRGAWAPHLAATPALPSPPPPRTLVCARMQVIKLSKELPVVVEYRVADFGYVRYYLAPKVRGEGDSDHSASALLLLWYCGLVLVHGVGRCNSVPPPEPA